MMGRASTATPCGLSRRRGFPSSRPPSRASPTPMAPSASSSLTAGCSLPTPCSPARAFMPGSACLPASACRRHLTRAASARRSRWMRPDAPPSTGSSPRATSPTRACRCCRRLRTAASSAHRSRSASPATTSLPAPVPPAWKRSGTTATPASASGAATPTARSSPKHPISPPVARSMSARAKGRMRCGSPSEDGT